MLNRHFLLVALAFTVSTAPAFSENDKPPAPAAPRRVVFAEPKKTTLENGLSVIVIERRGLPLVSMNLLVKSGAEVDPPGLAGLANVTAALLTKGTEKRTAPLIARELETLGANIETAAGWDESSVKITALAAQMPRALEIVADLVRHPIFADEEIGRLQKQIADDLAVALEEPGAIAKYAMAKVIFGDGAYGHAVTGTPETVAKITRDAVVKLHREFYRPDNVAVIFCGDITSEHGVELAQKFFGDWKKPDAPLAAISKSDAEKKPERRVVVIDMPGAGQAAVMAGKTGIARDAKNYFDGEVANTVLGGGYSSRLNAEIRVKRGLTYGAGSQLDARTRLGPFVASAQTKNVSAAEVATLMLGEFSKLGAEKIPAEELATRKATLAGGFARHLETNEGFASVVAGYELRGLPVNSANDFLGKIESVSADDAQKFAAEIFQADDCNIVIAGDAKQFRAALAKQFKKIEVIRKDELDLNAVSLKRAKKEDAR
jgi:zinc protease